MRDRMNAHRVLGMACMRQGELLQAEAHERTVLEIAEREGTPFEQGHALIEVANLMVAFGPLRFEPALELYSRAAELFASGEDYGSQARVMMNRAVLEWTAGRMDEALKHLTVAIEAADRSRSPRWIGYCHINLAQLQVELGRTDLARPALERATQVLSAVGDGFADQQIVMTRGMIAHADRAFELAEANYRESLGKARHLHLPSEVSEVLWRLAQLFHDRGDDARSREWLADARAHGLLDHHPDFVPRVAALERSLAASPDRGC
jgi:tetratricopeptide (TPR) repeat protein